MKTTERICLSLIALLVTGALIAATPISNLVFQSDVDADGHQISNLGSPTNSSNAATLGYVTNQISSAATNYATAAQGTLADTALQPGTAITNVSGLQTALDLKLDDSQASAFGLTLLDDPDAATARTTLGLGTLATQSGTFGTGSSIGSNVEISDYSNFGGGGTGAVSIGGNTQVGPGNTIGTGNNIHDDNNIGFGNYISHFNNIGNSNNIGEGNNIGSSAVLTGDSEASLGGSTSGLLYYTMPFRDIGYKKVMLYAAALVGTASFTFPVPFQRTPAIVATNGPAASVVTSLSTTAVTITGATTTGWIILEGY